MSRSTLGATVWRSISAEFAWKALIALELWPNSGFYRAYLFGIFEQLAGNKEPPDTFFSEEDEESEGQTMGVDDVR